MTINFCDDHNWAGEDLCPKCQQFEDGLVPAQPAAPQAAAVPDNATKAALVVEWLRENTNELGAAERIEARFLKGEF